MGFCNKIRSCFKFADIQLNIFLERRYSPKRETTKDLYAVHFSTPEKNLPFYQHGDVAFVELPPDFDLRTGKVNATRSYSNAKVFVYLDNLF